MKKSKSLLFTSGLVLLLAASGGYALGHQNTQGNKQATNIVRSSSSSKSSLSSQTQQSQETQADSQIQTATALRSDLVSNPVEQEVTENLITQGQDIIANRQISQQSSSFDFASLALGDFSSLAGTWADANGYTFEFSEQGLVTADGSLTLSALVYDENGEAVSNVYLNNGGGFLLHYYPAGLEIPSWHFGITTSDPSDFGRDRLFATQTNRFDYESTTQFVNSVFYKVSDATSQVSEDSSSQEAESSQETEIIQENQTETTLSEAPESSETTETSEVQAEANTE